MICCELSYFCCYLSTTSPHGQHLYLVTEYVDGCALSEFVKRAHEYIAADKLSRDEYSECIKHVMWQLVHTIKWLHSTMKCVHMDLCCDNVMVSGIHFVPDPEDDTVQLDGKAVIKLIDFGVAEVESLSLTL